MIMTKKKLFVVAWSTFFLNVSFVYFMFSRKIFPSYFFNDNVTIRNYMSNINMNSDKNYVSTAKLFLMFHFNANTSFAVESFFSWIIFSILLLILILKFNIDFFKTGNFLLLIMFTFLYGAYSAQFSKELVIFIMLDIMLLIFPSKYLNKELAFFILLYGFLFRTYWILIFLCSILFFFIFNSSKLKKVSKLGLYFVSIIVMEISYNLITGGYLSDARYSVNSFRSTDLYTNTIINNPFINTSVLTDFFNFIYGLINIFIPIDGINSVNEVAYYLWIWIILILCIKYIRGNNGVIDYKLFFALSMITIQSFFEPDVGSMLRHQIVLIPTILLMINTNNSCTQRQQDIEEGELTLE